MSQEFTAILISVVSILVASLSLGWNIYRDVILKARIKVTFMFGLIVHPNLNKSLERLFLSATNFGPGIIRLKMIYVKESSLLKLILRKTKLAVLLNNNMDPLSAKLPCDLEIGNQMDFLLEFNEDCFLSENWTHIGIKDSFSRVHWAPRKSVKIAKKSYLERFKHKKP
jgi:hypothetical protein